MKKSHPRARHARRPLLWAALLLAALALSDGFLPNPARGRPSPPAVGITVADAREAEGQETYEELQDYLNGLEQAEDVERVVAYRILLQFLPTGTRMTSGFRSKEKQLSLIRDFARRNGIAVPERMVVDEPETWTSAWLSLRSKGFIIASPNHTPHGDPDRIVFDLAGSSLSGIVAGCRAAEGNNMVRFAQIIVEPKNGCVHVEVASFAARALGGLRTRPRYAVKQTKPGDGPGANSSANLGTGTAAVPTSSPDEEKQARMQERQTLLRDHDATPDLRKKMEYDYLLIQTIDPSDTSELSYRSVLLNEIREHEQQAKEAEVKAEQDNAVAEKQHLIAQVEAAQREGRDAEAERLAKTLSDTYPEHAKVYSQMVTRRMIREAIDAFIQGGCNKCAAIEEPGCANARELIDVALRDHRGDEQAQRLKEEMEIIRGNCGAARWVRVVLLVVLVVGLGVGLYFWLRPGKYVLEGVLGPCKGQVFALDKPRVRIGAMPPEEEEENVDIHISDRERKISRVHCLLTQSGRYWYLKDESSNGTKVNDLAVQKGSHQRLAGGDEISLADEAVLVFRRR